MRILLDKNVPYPLKRHLQHHVVGTAAEEGWDTLANGQLLAAAEQKGYEVLVACDQNIRHQQNLRSHGIAIVAIGTNIWPVMNIWPVIRQDPTPIVQAVDAAQAGTYKMVDYTKPPRPPRPAN